MKNHAKNYLMINILKIVFLNLSLLFFIFKVSCNVSAMTHIDPNDPKISTNNSLIIVKHPAESPVHIDVDGPSPMGRKRAPEGEGNNDGKGWTLTDLNNILTVSNGGYRDFQAEYGAETIVWPANTLKSVNKVTATYGVVGTYKGRDVTAKVELSNFEGIPTSNGNTVDWLIFSDSLWSGLCYYGVESFTQTFHFFYTDGSPVHFDISDNSHTYITYNSMNGAKNYQGQDNKFSEWVSGQNSKESYVTTSTIEEDGKFGSGFSGIGGMEHWNHKYDNDPKPFSEEGFEDKLGAETYTDASSVWEIGSDAPAFIVGSERNHQGYMTWLSFSSATIWNNEPAKPIKDVIENGQSINGKLVIPHEKFEYTVSQKVGIMGQDMLTKYRQFEISDPLPKEVTYLDSAYVVDDSTGKRLDANAGAFTYKNGILTFKFSYNYLKNIMAYEGETYTVHIPVQVKGNVKLSSKLKSIDNDASTVINGRQRNTNKVSNPVPEDHDTKIRKKIFTGKLDKVTDWQGLFNAKLSDDFNNSGEKDLKTKSKIKNLDTNGNYDGSEVLVNSQTMTGKDDTNDIIFAEQFKFSKVGDFGSVTLIDNLDPALTVKKVTILNDKGKDITLDGRLTTSNGNISWLANDPESFRDNYVYMIITVNLTKSFNFSNTPIDSQTGNYIIPNTASAIVDDKPFSSNEVHVIVPHDGLAPSPIKSVVDTNNFDINHKLVKDGDIIYYHVDQKVGNLGTNLLKKYRSFKLSDKLDVNLKYQDSYVINKETGKRITDTNTTQYDPKTRTVTWEASKDFLENGMKYKGEIYELVIKAKVDTTETINNTIGDSNINNVDGRISIKNIGQSIINGNSRKTNEVENPVMPRPANKPIKNVVDKDDGDINHKVVSNGDILYYHIDQHVGTLGKDLISRYKKFSILDKLDGDLDFVKAYLVNKTTKEVLSDPSEVTFDEATNLVTWTASDEFLKSMPLKGETYELIIEAKVNIKDPNQNKTKDSIKNTATANIDDNPQITNEVENPLTPPDYAPEKTVLNNDNKDINHKTVVNGQQLIYHVSKKVGTLGFGLAQRYKEFTIIDKLDKNVQFDSAYVQNADTKAKVSNPSEVSYDKDSNTVKFTASNQFLSQMPLKGETYDFVITVTVNIQDEDLDKEVEIDNVGSVILDNQPQDTNTVDNHYQPVTPEAPTKSVVNHDGKDINHQIVSDGDTIYYHVDKKVGTLNQDLAQRYKEFSMTDKLDHNLTFIKAYVINKETGKTVSQPAEITVSDNTVTWKASANFLKSMPLKGETYELVIEAKVNVSDKASSTDEVTIENIASVSIDNQPQQTNAVDNKLNSKGQAPKPTKKVVNKDGKDINNTTVKVGDTLYYHVDQKVGTLGKDLSERYPQFTIKDQLDQRLTYVNAYVVNKADGKKMSNDSEISFDESSNTVLFTASPDFLKAMPLKGETYELVIEVKVNKGAATIANAETRSDKSGNTAETSQSNQDDAATDQTTKPGTTENGTESDSAADVQVIRNVATSDLGNNPQDTNEVVNNLKGNPVNNPKDDKQSKDSMPEDEPSYKKMAQTGSKVDLSSYVIQK